ncbi:MAG: M50 family metallopeptidase [Candidatus Kapabacteria bacterium]|nr:M50 family metallopeptidase [Candidatus Kapabacteria bacterium]
MTKESGKYLLIFFGFGIVTFILWQFPFGRVALYPFTILGTWFHEMGHGLTAMILGGKFIELVIFPDGSGYARFTTDLFLGNIGQALVAMGGPIGPTIAGSIFIVSTKKMKLGRIVMFLLGLFMLVSVLFWIRSFVGILIIALLGILIIYISIKGSDKLQILSLQFLGVQAIMSLYLSLDYLFSAGGNVGGSSFNSDTAVIAQYLLLPHWLWAILILAFSVFMIFFSIKFTFSENKKRLNQ